MTIPVNGSAANAPTGVASADVARVLLDSTVLIDALRGRPAGERLRALRRQGDEPWTCAISIEEIWRGLLPGEEAIAQRLVRGLRCAPLGPSEGIRAGRWRRQFAGRGITLHQADCLIAAATAGINARLATGNPADFPMDDITVEHWPVGRCVASPLGLGRSLHSHRNDAATTGESDPAITRSIAVFDGLRTTDAD
jgi:predicted nucleic acid-binding protein